MDKLFAQAAQADSEPAARSAAAEAGEEKLSDRLYARIFEGIVQGEYPPDSRLPSETALARRFAVSRPVVREALARLRDHGLVASRQGSGSYVRRRPDSAMLSFAPVGSIGDIQRCFEFRAAFEGRAAGLAATRHDEQNLGRIGRALAELAAAIDNGTLGVDADFAFHHAIAAATRNHFFTATLSMLESQTRFGMTLSRNLSLRQATARRRTVQEEHERVAEAIARRDAAAAERAMNEHIENAWRRMLDGPPALEES